MNSRPAIERLAGVMVPLFSLRTRNDAGIGDIAALDAMTGLVSSMGDRAILLLPIDETSPGQASPYSALSAFAIDPIYIGLHGLAPLSRPVAAAWWSGVNWGFRRRQTAAKYGATRNCSISIALWVRRPTASIRRGRNGVCPRRDGIGFARTDSRC